jgi:hypothetical protein
MGNALLYYRTSTTTSVLVPNPANLPSAQKLEFEAPANLFEGIEKIGVNNLVVTPSPNTQGIRQTTLEDNGLKTITIRFHGNFDTEGADGNLNTAVKKLENFFGQHMVEEAFHKEGIFGIMAEETDAFDVDPDAVHGLGIEKFMLKHVGPLGKIFDFSVDLVFGGTRTNPSV